MSVRRYVAVVQAAEGYPPPGADLEADGPVPPVIHSVVLADDYEALVAEMTSLCELNAELVARCSAEDGTDLPPARDLDAMLTAALADRVEARAEADRLRRALKSIRTHARLDVAERGVSECARYEGIATAALALGQKREPGGEG